MNYDYHKKKYPENVLVSIEDFDKQAGIVLFDFYDSNEYTTFLNYINIENNFYFNTNNNISNPSMVLIKNYKLRTIRENTIYSIKRETIENWKLQNIISNENESSFLIGHTIDLMSNEGEIFTTSVSLNDSFESFFLISNNYKGNYSDIPISLFGRLSVIVRNIGHGNWNEVYSNNEVKIVYDAGASLYASKNDIIKIIGNRSDLYSKAKPGFILSHWDKDHYHSLLGMSINELSYFSFFICRNELPNLTSRILHHKIISAIGINKIFNIPAEQKDNKGGPTYLIPITPIENQLVIYNSQFNYNRNISGIVLSIKTKESSIILSGDVHYEQISRDILPHLNYPHNHNLVIPHHGGKAGKFIYKLPNRVSPSNAIVSVGKNHYGHPLSNITESLESNRFKILQTKLLNKDISIDL